VLGRTKKEGLSQDRNRSDISVQLNWPIMYFALPTDQVSPGVVQSLGLPTHSSHSSFISLVRHCSLSTADLDAFPLQPRDLP